MDPEVGEQNSEVPIVEGESMITDYLVLRCSDRIGKKPSLLTDEFVYK